MYDESASRRIAMMERKEIETHGLDINMCTREKEVLDRERECL